MNEVIVTHFINISKLYLQRYIPFYDYLNIILPEYFERIFELKILIVDLNSIIVLYEMKYQNEIERKNCF